MIGAWVLAAGSAVAAPAAAPLEWVSPHAHRLILAVDGGRRRRSNSVASIDVDFDAELARHGGGTFDEGTLEVIAYDASGRPRVVDAGGAGHERFLVPWRLDRSYPLARLTLRFVVPDERATRYAVYFDTRESGRGRADRYPGLVGDGDLFMQGFGRREVGASAHDGWGDIDADGDLDLLKGGTEPFLSVLENVGAGRFVDRGRLTSAGEPLVFPHDDGNRAWLSPEAADWDGDGDLDLFVFFLSGPSINRVVRYENVTGANRVLTFAERGPLSTVSGRPLTDRVRVVDWDGDGVLDVLCSADGLIAFHRNVGGSRSVADMKLADGTYLRANGTEIQLDFANPEAADLDADGDLDLLVGTEEGRVFFFENVGARGAPVLAVGRLLAFFEYMDAKAAVKAADFDGDGLLDLVVGRYWERAHFGDEPRVFGRFFKNVGTPTAPRFEPRDATAGAPHTEGLQPVDAVRQNGVRATDWDGDGKVDLVVGDTDGFVWLFRNATGARAPLFPSGERLRAGGAFIKVYGEENEARLAGYARVDVADWNGDGRKDLFVADGRGWLWVYLNRGTDRAPVLGGGQRVRANGQPIDGTSRGSVLVRDWDGDGRLDVVFAMVGEDSKARADWPPRNADPSTDRGFLFYRNLGSARQPALTAPKWVNAGPQGRPIDVERPNLGDLVDWNGDGLRDLLACQFENDCRVWVNTRGGPGKPIFGGRAEGEKVLAPWTSQMISGVHARDWNGDGDIDLLTGQGHGGSGVRFYERDHLEDVRRGALPRVTIERSERLKAAAKPPP